MATLRRRSFLRGSVAALAGALSGCGRPSEPDPVVQTLPVPTASQPAPESTPAEVRAATPAPTASTPFLSLHPFVEAHPEAVFIRRTAVTDKTDSEAKRHEGLALAASLFAPGDTPGIPRSARLAIKPNLTCAEGQGNTPNGMGILTDRYFLQGVIEALTAAGFPADQTYVREGNWLGDGYCSTEASSTGYPELAQSTGVHLTDFPNGRLARQLYVNAMEEDSEIVWVDVPDGVVLRRIPYVAPFNAADSWLLDVAKLKTHGMGLTLAVKNLQGTIVPPYTRFCEGVDATLQHPSSMLANFAPGLADRVNELHETHRQAGYPRWDRPGRSYDGGYGMEMWAQRTCDSLSVTPVGLAMVEGIYGRNGNAFMKGPGPGGTAEDFLMNVVLFGKNPFLVDIIGVWLAGHEPGNMGLFRIAQERGLSPMLNPFDIPVYLWEDEPALANLADLERTPLLTNYMRRDYDGQSEPVWHLLDEPCDYGAPQARLPERPAVRILGARNPGVVAAASVIEYATAAPGEARLEMLDSTGACVAVLADGRVASGTHAATWQHGLRQGEYTCRLSVAGHNVCAPVRLA
ncbi:MAG: DUF362 domain-containing protein [Chloroflexi bacterium]|nr:DUF362 domain-containing protein [Chloroflexota bacterium]